jgi:hypothetical protein
LLSLSLLTYSPKLIMALSITFSILGLLPNKNFQALLHTSSVQRGVFGGFKPPSPRNSEDLTKSNRIAN